MRDRQVLKKEQIKTLIAQEEFRVDNACRKDTNLGFTIGQTMEKHRHDEDLRYGAMLKDQLRQKEEERMMDKESNAAEGRRALQYARRLQHEEVADNIRTMEDRRTVTRGLIAENNKVRKSSCVKSKMLKKNVELEAENSKYCPIQTNGRLIAWFSTEPTIILINQSIDLSINKTINQTINQ